MASIHDDLDEARASLIARIEELGRRLHEARERLDIAAYITAHPLASVGAAAAVGALLGLRRRKPRAGHVVERSFAGAVAAGVGALALRVAKEIAFKEVADVARGWWSSREAAASHDPQMEMYFEH
jgi:hypothetical protein